MIPSLITLGINSPNASKAAPHKLRWANAIHSQWCSAVCSGAAPTTRLPKFCLTFPMENGAPTGPSLDRHLNFTERIEERHILASRRALANNKAGGAQMRPPRTPGCKHKLAGIGRLLVPCASQARMHITHDPRHEKVADRRGSLPTNIFSANGKIAWPNV